MSGQMFCQAHARELWKGSPEVKHVKYVKYLGKVCAKCKDLLIMPCTHTDVKCG